MRKSILSFTLFLFFVLSNVHSQERGMFAIHSEVDPLNLADFMGAIFSNSTSPDPSCKIGLRIYPTAKFGVDLSGGLYMSTGYKRDSLSNTSESPGGRNLMLELGLILDAFQGEKAALGLLGKLGISFQQLSDNAYTGGSYTKYKKYDVTVPSVFMGFEPSYLFSEHFGIFSRFGINMVFLPNSKEIDTTDPAYNWATNSFPLITKKDTHTNVSTDGVTLGVRYYF